MNPIDAPRPEGAEEMPQATRLDDVRIRDVRPLISPALLQYELPADEAVQAFIERSRTEVAAAVHGTDPRLLVVVGPCSIHDHAQAMEYARRLRGLADELREDLLLVMRVYFEKPRTTVGWKGYINDPRLDGSFRINEGLRLARQLLLEIAQLGLPAGTEFLDLLSPQYISDLISWGAIGARTTESPSHRQLASGLSCAIGFKNGTDGSVQMAADALQACRAPHAFMGMTKMGVAAVFETEGNADCHIILRGGSRGPNYAPADIEAACALARKGGGSGRVMVDCSHANSGKDYRKQPEVARELARQIAGGERRILGVMVESHLHGGRQDLEPGKPLQPGVSITDGCLGWEQTQDVLRELAAAVRSARAG
ncbi:3-deoxy-7-phosphoheptulonate synthase [Ramlibacter ginsenosidimutans]|uniref:Phospho-2-dehydro-3-deoxyheptonate aldolase n=1 Tax=Ramlibacter ginsenosidimutans TaxID=502333 RepID=A0A934WLP0_9BURK|nr:3-deoxy-7-phosphoheptulonate synthase [Ramlibacter ginsenosidimutans]MBK6006994.1 3-deoxy-7-phosphoheptulonate synthase [Ramlibacter ginsenosidimutans]